MKIFRNVAPAGDEYLRLSGYLRFSEAAQPVDPSTNGFAFFLTADANRNILIGRELPPGTERWRQSSNKRLWLYSDPTGSVGGVTKVGIIRIPLRGPNYYRVAVTAPKGDFLLPPSNLPVNLVFAMGGTDQAIGGGLCASQVFSPRSGPRPVCRTIRATLVCR